MNSLIAIHPYKYEGMWVFDDAAVGLAHAAVRPFLAALVIHVAVSSQLEAQG